MICGRKFYNYANSSPSVIPATDTIIRGQAAAGIQQDKNALYLKPLDSRLRGNDGIVVLSI